MVAAAAAAAAAGEAEEEEDFAVVAVAAAAAVAIGIVVEMTVAVGSELFEVLLEELLLLAVVVAAAAAKDRGHKFCNTLYSDACKAWTAWADTCVGTCSMSSSNASIKACKGSDKTAVLSRRCNLAEPV